MNPEEPSATASVVVSTVILEHERLLMVREGKPWCRNQWSVPGGRVEQGEGLLEAARREVTEETGFDIEVVGITRVLRYISQLGFHCIRFNFVGKIIGGSIREPDDEILEIAWMTLAELDALPDQALRTAPTARRMITDVRSGVIHPIDILHDALSGSHSN